MRLNLCCGKAVLEGYVNVDWRIEEPMRHVTSLQADARFLPFCDRSFTHVRMNHALEHFALEGIRIVTDEVWRVLKYRGEFYVNVPNICFALSSLKEGGYSDATVEKYATMVWGNSSEMGYAGQSHRFGFTHSLLQWMLSRRGFHHAETLTGMNTDDEEIVMRFVKRGLP